jgi:hypothetical protein
MEIALICYKGYTVSARIGSIFMTTKKVFNWI